MNEKPQPGWYPDPSNSHNMRWWDGSQWSDVSAPPPPFSTPNYSSNPPIESNRLNRFVARFIDGLILGIPFMVLFFVVFGASFAQLETQEVILDDGTTTIEIVGGDEIFGIAYFGIIIFLALLTVFYQYYMLYKQSATIGKKAMGLKVINDQTGELVQGDKETCLKRALTELLFSVPFVASIVALVNAVMVLAEPHRSIYDRIAQTRVIKR